MSHDDTIRIIRTALWEARSFSGIAALDELVAENERYRGALTSIVAGIPPEGALHWTSGRSWRIEVARAALAVGGAPKEKT